MAVYLEKSCAVTMSVEPLTPEEVERDGKFYVRDAAEMASGKSNVWSNGIKKTLVYDPEGLRETTYKLDNLEMINLADILQRERTYRVTPSILEAALETKLP